MAADEIIWQLTALYLARKLFVFHKYPDSTIEGTKASVLEPLLLLKLNPEDLRGFVYLVYSVNV